MRFPSYYRQNCRCLWPSLFNYVLYGWRHYANTLLFSMLALALSIVCLALSQVRWALHATLFADERCGPCKPPLALRGLKKQVSVMVRFGSSISSGPKLSGNLCNRISKVAENRVVGDAPPVHCQRFLGGVGFGSTSPRMRPGPKGLVATVGSAKFSEPHAIPSQWQDISKTYR